ncbi:MAG TPA: S8 family serine peptidase [Gemmatimonadales bacterium]|nr:S8 family serine peptidase [Gemmatimonadales bacterium]
MSPSRLLPIALGLLAACSSAPPASSPAPSPAPRPNAEPSHAPPPAKPTMDPAARERANITVHRDTIPVPEPNRVAPPQLAYQRGLMALASTGVDAFLRDHPTADGRGVLIGILDTGIDPSVPGLSLTTTGERKVLDLRDFSGEGAVALTRIAPSGDSVVVAGHALAGFSRVAALAGRGDVWGGAIREIPLGDPPASDLNGNGTAGDTLPVVVARASDGWVLFADTDGDGSLANERPIHDYLVAGETFGWRGPGRAAPVAIAVNFSGTGNEPALDLFFDTSSHGTFVSGVAAGHDLYGVKGFDGVAPGAQLLGLKIANDAQGGITTTGSMMRAIDYAIRFAGRRRMPLVLNMSFGVGNEQEGDARIDALVDSVLAAHPDLVFTISAGNDGPGLSTIGFPGSAARALTAGATLPGVFLPGTFGPPADQLAPFSARGGELAKPDVIAPGFAYSTVPRYNAGEEIKEGTSFSAPHTAGLAALLRSALVQANVSADAHAIKQALMVTARPQGGFAFIAEGAGLPDVNAALAWLRQGHNVADVGVRALGGHGATAAYRGQGLASAGDTLQGFELVPEGGAPDSFRLRSNAPWLVAPASAALGGSRSTVTLRYKAAALRTPGTYTGLVSGWTADTAAGPAFRLVNTVVVPFPAANAELASSAQLAPGAERRASFLADSARPFIVRVATASPLQHAIAALHEPDGMPFRNGQQQEASADSGAAVFRVDARDVVPGAYEAVAVGFPTAGSTVSMRVEQSPVRVTTRADGAGLAATLANATRQPVTARVGLALAGAERSEAVTSQGGDTVRIPFTAPAWARRAEVDIAMAPAQWERFTDFGVTLFDSTGRQIAKLPLNYAFGRLQAPLPPDRAARPVALELFPGLAERGSSETWKARVTIRLYADSATAPARSADARTALTIPPGDARTATLAAPRLPWPLPERFHPLGVVVVRGARGQFWTRETALGNAAQGEAPR